MIITLKNADFSKNNINSLLTTWPISKTLRGVTASNSATSVEKGAGYTCTFTIQEGYELKVANVVVKMGDAMQMLTWSSVEAGGQATLSIPSVTAAISISIKATAISGEPEEPDVPVDPETPTTLTLHKSATGNSILDYKDVWKMFGAASLQTLGSQIIGVDVSAYAGQTITITAAQSVITDANYAMFCSNLPNSYIKSLSELDGYNSFGTATEYTPESYDNLIESFNISAVAETTNTVYKVVPANAKYLFFSNLSTKCANPTVVVGGDVLVTYVTEDGWSCMDYQTYFYLTANSTFKGYQSKVIAADVSKLVGKTLSITATQSIVDGAYYSFFTNALPEGISSIEQINNLTYSSTGKYNFAESALVSNFNVATEHQKPNTITTVVPTGAKYLFVNSLNKFGGWNINIV